jgi:hypothetical protein
MYILLVYIKQLNYKARCKKSTTYFKAKVAILMAFNNKVCMEQGRKNPSLQVMTYVDWRMWDITSNALTSSVGLINLV